MLLGGIGKLNEGTSDSHHINKLFWVVGCWHRPETASYTASHYNDLYIVVICHKAFSFILKDSKTDMGFLTVILKSTRPSLPLKKAPPLFSVFSPQGRRGNRSSSSLWTISFYGWRTIRGLRQQRSCSFLCGMNPPCWRASYGNAGTHDAGRLLHATVASFRVWLNVWFCQFCGKGRER